MEVLAAAAFAIGIFAVALAAYVAIEAVTAPEWVPAIPEPPAQVDRPAGTNRVDVRVGGVVLYATTSQDSGQLMRK